MLRRLLSVLGITLLYAALCLGQQTQTTTTTTTEPGSVTIENLFAQADVVAFVEIRSGDAEAYESVVYKAVVLKPYKGSKVNEVIYFTPFKSYGVGSEYLLFVKRTDKRLSDIVSQDSKEKRLPYDSAQGFYRIMYEGYSVMPVSFECVFEKPTHQTCDYAVKFNTKQVRLPVKLKTFPDDGTEVDFSDVTKYVKRKAIESVLDSLAGR